MVKRAPTPPPRPDDPKIVVVTHPYPHGPNLERRDDLLGFVFWIACCMDGHYNDLYSVWHKPTAADMILIEVCHGFDGYRGLLGEHRWSEFLRKPPRFENSISRIYPSTFANGRAVEKAGWKRIFVEDEWFERFSAKTAGPIVYPYPVSRYCLTPKEDQTTANVCLPLPLDLFNLRAPTPPSAPVGSPQWTVQKEAMVRSTPPRFSFSAVSRALGSSARPPLVLPARASSSKSSQPSRSPLPPPRHSVDVGPLSGLASTGLPDWPQLPETEVTTMVDGTPFLGSDDGDTVIEGDDVGKSGTAPPFEDFGFGSLAIAAPSPKEPEKIVCPTHGTICKKGICKDYRNHLRKIEREKDGEGRGGHNGSKRGGSPRGGSFSFRGRKRGGW